MTGQTPIARFRVGQMVSAVWKNNAEVKGRTVTILKASVQRRYKDKDGNWQSSGSFSRNEIPLAIYCLQRAFDKIVELQNTAADSNDNNGCEEIPILD